MKVKYTSLLACLWGKKANQSDVVVGSNPIAFTLYTPKSIVNRWRPINKSFGTIKSAAVSLDSKRPNAKKESILIPYVSLHHLLTLLQRHDGFGWIQEEHNRNHDTKDLHAITSHINHDGIHGNTLGWTPSNIPSTLSNHILISNIHPGTCYVKTYPNL